MKDDINRARASQPYCLSNQSIPDDVVEPDQQPPDATLMKAPENQPVVINRERCLWKAPAHEPKPRPPNFVPSSGGTLRPLVAAQTTSAPLKAGTLTPLKENTSMFIPPGSLPKDNSMKPSLEIVHGMEHEFSSKSIPTVESSSSSGTSAPVNSTKPLSSRHCSNERPDPSSPVVTPPQDIPSSSQPRRSPIIVGVENLPNTTYTRLISVDDIWKPTTFIPDSIVRDISKLVLTKLPPGVSTWHKVPLDVNEEMFQDFFVNHKFVPSLSKGTIRKAFTNVAKRRLCGQLYNFRQKAMAKTNGNILAFRHIPPSGISLPVWQSLCDAWSKEDLKKKSDAGKSNRASKPGAVIHTGGSIRFAEHLRWMEVKEGGLVHYQRLYEEMHKSKKTKTFVTNSARELLEQYNTKVVKKYGSDHAAQPQIDAGLWEEVIGRTKGGYLRGLGTTMPTGKPAECPNIGSPSTERINKRSLSLTMERILMNMSNPIAAVAEPNTWSLNVVKNIHNED